MKLVVLALLLAGGVAHADKVKTRVFPLSGAPDSGVQTKMTRALADSIGADVANVPLEDAAGLLECDPESSTCLGAVAKSVAAERLVFGVIVVESKSKLKVTLTRFDPAGPDRQQRTFEIRGKDGDELATELVRVSGPLFGKPEGNKRIVPDDQPDKPDGPDKPDPTPETPTKGGKVSAATWAIGGGGAIAVAAGVGFLLSAQSIKKQVDQAPMNTVEDFEALQKLEDRGVLRTRIGDVLVIAGAAGLAVAIVRGIKERRKEPSTVVTPTPIDGGAAIVLRFTR